MFFILLSALILSAVLAEPVIWPIYEGDGHYVSPAIGFGHNGGNLSVHIELANNNSITFLTVLSVSQLEGWKPVLDPDSGRVIEVRAMTSSYLREILNGSLRLDNIVLSHPSPEQYVVLIVTDQTHPTGTETRIVGSMAVDWVQADGTYLQFQYLKLRSALTVIEYLTVVCLGVYIFNLVVFAKNANLIHYLYTFFMAFVCMYMYFWANGVAIERDTGDRTSLFSRWVPGLLEKGFDICEVLLYLVTAVGWKSVRAQLYPTEIQFIVVGSLISLLLGVFEIALQDDAVSSGNFTSARMIIHMFGYLAAIVGFNFQLAFGNSILQESSIASRDTARTYFFVNRFWWFRAIFLAFIVQPTVSVIVRSDVLGWQDDWIFVAFFWATKIGLLVSVAFLFRPQPVPRMALVELAIKERRIQQTRLDS